MTTAIVLLSFCCLVMSMLLQAQFRRTRNVWKLLDAANQRHMEISTLLIQRDTAIHRLEFDREEITREVRDLRRWQAVATAMQPATRKIDRPVKIEPRTRKVEL